MPDETRLQYLLKRNTKVCSRTVRAIFTAYGSPEIRFAIRKDCNKFEREQINKFMMLSKTLLVTK